MKMELLISILVVAGVLGLTGLAFYLKDKHIYNPADIAYIQSLFNIGTDVVDELNLKEEPQIRLIAQIVSDCLKQIMTAASNAAETDLEATAMKTVTDSLAAANITMTPERQQIVQGLIDAVLNGIGKKTV